MRLFSHVMMFVSCVLFVVGCGEEASAPANGSADPTPGQLSQALSDPAFVEAAEMLAGDGLGVDTAAGHVISDEAGNWALEVPVVRLYTGGVVPYEALVYEVMAGVGDVYFVLAADGGGFESPPEGVEPAASEEPRLGTATYNANVCGPWSAWYRIGWICRSSTYCNRKLFAIQERQKQCRNERGTRWTVYETRQVQARDGCGC